jgi:hypothetical protein
MLLIGGAVLLRKDLHKSEGADFVDSKEAASNGRLPRSPEKKQVILLLFQMTVNDVTCLLLVTTVTH